MKNRLLFKTIKQIHIFFFFFKPKKIYGFYSILKKKNCLGLILVGQDFYLVGQGSLCLNKSGQCSKSIFSYTVRGFDPIPRLRARPKCQFQNSTEILCYFLCYFLKTPEFGRSPEFWEPATALYLMLDTILSLCLSGLCYLPWILDGESETFLCTETPFNSKLGGVEK